MITCVGKGCGETRPSSAAGGDVKSCSHLENSLAVPQVVKQSYCRATDSPHRYTPKINEDICPQRSLCTNVQHGSHYSNSPKVETSQMPINHEWTDKFWDVIYQWKEWDTQTHCSSDRPWQHPAQWRHRNHVLQDSSYWNGLNRKIHTEAE